MNSVPSGMTALFSYFRSQTRMLPAIVAERGPTWANLDTLASEKSALQPSSTQTVLRFWQSLNASSPMSLSVQGSVISSIPLDMKHLSPMCSMLSGSSTPLRCLQFLNISTPIRFSVEGSLTLSSAHPENTSLSSSLLLSTQPSFSSPSFSYTLLNCSQSQNAC